MRPAECLLAAAGALVLAVSPAPGASSLTPSGWSVTTLSAPSANAQALDLDAVSCPADNDCWVGGTESIPGNAYHSVFAHWDGSAWTYVGSPAAQPSLPVEVRGLTCTSPAECWAVGQVDIGRPGQSLPPGALVERWHRGSWSIVPLPALGPRAGLHAVTCETPSLCFAVGTIRRPPAGFEPDHALVLKWDGTVWSIAPLHDAPVSCHPGEVCGTSLTAVACGDTEGDGEHPGCVAVGSVARTPAGTTSAEQVIEVLAGGSWSLADAPRPADAAAAELTGVACESRVAAPPEATASGSPFPRTSEPSEQSPPAPVQTAHSPSIPSPSSRPSESGQTGTPAPGDGTSSPPPLRVSPSPGRPPVPTPPVASGHASGGETASTSEEGRSSSGSATSAGATTASSSPSGAPGALGTTRLCVAVGTYQHAGEFRFGGRTVEGWDSPYALEWDGARWTLTLLPVGTNEPDVVVHGLACVRPAQEAGPRSRAGASSSCLAVGDSSLVQDLPTSRAWIRVQSPWQSVDTSGLDRSANSLGAVSCAPDGVCLATGWTVYRSTTSQPIAAGDDRASGIALAAATASRQAVVARYSILPPATSASGATTSNRSVLVSVLGAAVLLIAAGLIAYRRWRARGALRRVGG